ncbi:hypothetical protein M378DRAFT_154848 [Amanita muscaria Koide BX008]|uniref:Uncharacterized protein n=1 Tax=Amanita muscaria (strain Koide BX008) TaxID=946122 RepID=A0A0C2TVE0_AMAMK|nr:hypothetical protein M378DRAFT_154848 [Amanita muscaria Koide BX008]
MHTADPRTILEHLQEVTPSTKPRLKDDAPAILTYCKERDAPSVSRLGDPEK